MKLRVGEIIYGFAGGHFGRDSYDNRRVEAIGYDWVVTRNSGDEVEFYTGPLGRLEEFTGPGGRNLAGQS